MREPDETNWTEIACSRCGCLGEGDTDALADGKTIWCPHCGGQMEVTTTAP